MTRTIYALGALLILQLALTVGVDLSHRHLSGQPAEVALLKLSPGDVSRLSITDGDGNSVTLAKGDSGWTLPDNSDFPANKAKVKKLIDDLTAAQEGAPVATSKGAATRFKVSGDSFERKIVFGPPDKPKAVVYLGTSMGVRQVSARRDGQSGVRRITFSTYRVPAKPDDWIDPGALQLDAAHITGLSWGDVVLTKAAPKPAGDKAASSSGKAASGSGSAKAADTGTAPAPTGWQLALAGAPAEKVDNAPVTALTGKLAGLRVNGLAAADAKPADPPALKLHVTLDDGKSVDLVLAKLPDGKYEATSSALPAAATMTGSVAQALIKATTDPAFLPAPAAADAAPANAPGSVAAAPAPASSATAPAPATAPAASTGG